MRNEWIATKEKKPSDSGDYLTTNVNHRYYEPEINYYDKHRKAWNRGYPTHWMSLPDPPEEE